MRASGKRFVARRPFPSRLPVETSEDKAHQFQFEVGESSGADHETAHAVLTADTGAPENKQNLDQEQVQHLFNRASFQSVDEADNEKEFFKREESIKPPKTSKIIQTSFPPAVVARLEDEHVDIEQIKALAQQSSGPLMIERHSPSENEISYQLPSIQLTFNQPMISIATLSEQTSADSLGISLLPVIEGQWKWLGTKTIQFEAKYRLPYATEYQLTVKKDLCQSIIGGKLNEDFLFQFTTPRVQVVDFSPSGLVQTLKPKCLLVLDQKVDESKILNHLVIRSSENQLVKSEDLLLLDEASAKDSFDRLKYDTECDYKKCVAFTFKNDLLRATAYTVELPKGCPSAEGPLISQHDWSTTFQTFEPLKIIDWDPNKKNEWQTVVPGQRWSITFNNQLEKSTVTKSLFKFEPEVPDLGVEHSPYDDRTIIFHNNSKPNIIYTLFIQSGTLKDTHGQTFEEPDKDQLIQFHVGDYRPAVGRMQGATGMIFMDPSLLDEPFYSFMVCNYSELHVRINRVTPEEYDPSSVVFQSYCYFDQAQKKISLPGTELFNQTITTDCQRDQPKEMKIFLKSYLAETGGVGQLMLYIEPTEKALEACEKHHWRGREVLSIWLQCTKLTADIFASAGPTGSLTVWVNRLENGAPVTQAKVSCSNKVQTTDQNGICKIDYIGEPRSKVIIESGNDVCFLSEIYNYVSDLNTHVWHVFNDRGLYRPQEEVHIKGYVRLLKIEGEALLPTYAEGIIDYTVHDARGEELHKSNLTLNQYGAFDMVFNLPDNVNLGDAYVRFNLTNSNSSTTHTFKVQEFRRPEYEVSSNTLPTTLHYSLPTVNDYILAKCQAKLFSGGHLDNAAVFWTVTAETTNYTPPSRSEYTFGKAQSFFCFFPNPEIDKVVYPAKYLEGRTNDKGEHEIKITYHGIEQEPSPIVINAMAAIRDLNNQTQETQANTIVHPCQYYVGFKLLSNYGKKDESIQTNVIVTDVDGKLVDNVQIECHILGCGKEKKEDKNGLIVYEDIKDEQNFTVLSSASDAVSANFTPKLGGRYKIKYVVKDEHGGSSMSSYDNLFVSGGYRDPMEQQKIEFVPMDTLTLIPNVRNYQPDDTCEVLILSPFSPANGLLVLDCDGQVGQHIPFEIETGKESTTVQFKISKDWIPKLTINAKVTGSTSRSTNNNSSLRPAFAIGTVEVEVSRDIYKLDVVIATKGDLKNFTPSTVVHVDVDVKQHSYGRPAENTEVCLVIVDEAILSLTGHDLHSPLQIFYPERSARITQYHARDRCLLYSRPNLEEFRQSVAISDSEGYRMYEMNDCCMRCCCASACCKSACFGGGMSEQSIAVRSNFNPLACWSPSSITNSDGRATFTFKLPDNLTRYRVWAMAANNLQYGLGETSFTVQLPVMVRPSPPRFLNYGDTANVAIILQNQTDHALVLHAGLRATNAKLIESETDKVGYSITLAANKRTVLTIPVTTYKAGKAKFQFVISTMANESIGSFGDAVELDLPVFTPSTSEAFATYGDTTDDEYILQPVKAPENVIPHFGELSIATSSTALASLTDAIISLYTYPFECTEQLSSRLLGIVSLWDVLQAFNCKELPSMETIKTRIESDVNKLKGRQYPNGGFGYWSNRVTDDPNPFMSVHATHCLVVLMQKQICDVDPEVFNNALTYLANIESHINQLSYAKYWSESTRFSLTSFALYVRAKSLQPVSKEALDLFDRSGFQKLSLEALGWMLIALSSGNSSSEQQLTTKIYQYLKGKVNETSETANFTTSYGDDGQLIMLHSDRRTDAILLEALLQIDPQSTLCTKLCKGLQAHKVKGAWKSTQENCFVLIALDKYFRIKEKDVPDFVARVWLNDSYCGAHEHKGRTTDTNVINIPMRYLTSSSSDGNNDKNLILHKNGQGRLYYRIGLKYAPSSLKINPINYGFKIERTYEAIDDPSHVEKQEEGIWKFKLGEKIKVILTMTVTQRRYHVALIDCLPAGCEALNTKLKGTLTGDTESSSSRSRHSNLYFGCRPYSILGWPEHENLRDERAEAFRSLLWPGVYEWRYVMRATSAGNFIIPPAKAEEMYAPEVFGRSATETVTIE